MNPGFTTQQQARRLEQVKHALARGHGYGWLVSRWNVSRPSVLDWCKRYVSPDDCVRLAENGISIRDKRDNPDTRGRLELIALCRSQKWTDTRIAGAIGITRSALCMWIQRNAPFGIEDALSDFIEEAA